ncbi:MAG: hypothetical protein JWL79_1847 [Frankiales bacterium]|nr:hypothetical protein [Frankiales bacterium]
MCDRSRMNSPGAACAWIARSGATFVLSHPSTVGEFRPKGIDRSSPLLAFTTLITCTLFILWLGLLAHRPESSAAWCFTLLSVAVALRISSLVSRPRTDLVKTYGYIFVFVWMCLSPLAQIASGRSPLGHTFSGEDHVRTFWVIVVGLGVYELCSRGSVTQAHWEQHFEIARTRLKWLTISTFLLVPVLLVAVGGPSVLFQSRQAFSTAVFGGSGQAIGALLNAALIVLPFICSFFWVIAHRSESGRDHLWLTTSLALNILINNPVAQSRFWIAVVYTSLTLGYVRAPQKVLRHSVPLVIAALLLVFPFADIFRYTQSTPGTRTSISAQLYSKGDFDAYPQVASSLGYTREVAFQPQQLVGLPLFWLPRSVWGSKPIDTGTELGLYEGLGNVNLSAPLWAEGWVAGGWVGLIAVFAIWGRLTVSRVINRLPGGMIFIPYQFILLRGSLLQAMGVTSILLLSVSLLRKRPGVANSPRQP